MDLFRFSFWIAATIAITIIPKSSQAFEVQRIGPASWFAIEDQIQFSPDGRYIAFFLGKQLQVYDTTGARAASSSLEAFPVGLVWSSDKDVVVTTHDARRDLSEAVTQILTLNVETEESTLLGEFRDSESSVFRERELKRRPSYSSMGAVFFIVDESGVRKTVAVSEATLSNVAPKTDSRLDHFYSWGKDGLYKVMLNSADSIKVGPRPAPFPAALLSPRVSPDERYVIVGGTMYDFLKSEYIVLDTMLRVTIEGATICGIDNPNFNPSSDKLVFSIGCEGGSYDDSDEFEVSKLGFYQLGSDTIVIPHELQEYSNPRAPIFSPNGNDILFYSDGYVFLITSFELGVQE